MKKLLPAGALLLFLVAACAPPAPQTAPVTAPPGQAALQLVVDPNPIMARRVSGNTYDFPFVIELREVNGVGVTIESVSMDVIALGNVRVHREHYDRERIRQRGFPDAIPAGGVIRYEMNLRRDVPDDRLFSSVHADVRVEAIDANGNRIAARQNVTVRR
jgi:hypothetical protein